MGHPPHLIIAIAIFRPRRCAVECRWNAAAGEYATNYIALLQNAEFQVRSFQLWMNRKRERERREQESGRASYIVKSTMGFIIQLVRFENETRISNLNYSHRINSGSMNSMLSQVSMHRYNTRWRFAAGIMQWEWNLFKENIQFVAHSRHDGAKMKYWIMPNLNRAPPPQLIIWSNTNYFRRIFQIE